jgi:hypothetical protein
MERLFVNTVSVHQNDGNQQRRPKPFVETGQIAVGQPFNPSRHIWGIYLPDIVARLPGFDQGRRLLTDGQKRLYERLVRFAGRNGACFPSHQLLGVELGKTDRQIRNDLKRLEAFGLIAHTRGAGRKSNSYQFLWHPIFEVERKCASGNSNRQDGKADGCLGGDLSGSDRKSEGVAAGNALPTNSVQQFSTLKQEQAECSSQAVDRFRSAPVTPKTADRSMADSATEEIRDALQAATGKDCRPGDSLPVDLMQIGEHLGANRLVVARWIYDTGLDKRRAGDPIRSHGFFLRVAEGELLPWMRRNANVVHRLEMDLRRDLTPSPEPSHASVQLTRDHEAGRRQSAEPVWRETDVGIAARLLGIDSVSSADFEQPAGAGVSAPGMSSDEEEL